MLVCKIRAIAELPKNERNTGKKRLIEIPVQFKGAALPLIWKDVFLDQCYSATEEFGAPRHLACGTNQRSSADRSVVARARYAELTSISMTPKPEAKVRGVHMNFDYDENIEFQSLSGTHYEVNCKRQ